MSETAGLLLRVSCRVRVFSSLPGARLPAQLAVVEEGLPDVAELLPSWRPSKSAEERPLRPLAPNFSRKAPLVLLAGIRVFRALRSLVSAAMPRPTGTVARVSDAVQRGERAGERRWSSGLQTLVRGPLLAGVPTRLVVAAWLAAAVPSGAAEEELAPEPTRATITKVERYTADDAARIVLHVSRPVQFQKGEAPAAGGAAPSLEVDLFDAAYAGQHGFETQGLVRRVRLVRVASAYRVAIDTSGPARHTAFYLPDPFRIVIDVTRRESRQRAPGRGRKVERVALDPGHGGVDPGATGALGTREKDVVLDIAHRAAPLLARELGVSALLTRDTDVRVPLEERVARANAFGADLFISIHCNAERSGSVRGAMTFVLDGSHGHAALGLMEQENASRSPDAAELSRFLDQFDDAVTAERSTTFALLLQRSTLASLAAGYPEAIDGGVHGAGFYVLVGARMPAVLFETSFVSNALEERRLGTERYRQKLADAIVNAVRAYRAGYPASAGRRAKPVRDTGNE